jgi:predicted transcriptional regulator of viral defense system
MDQIKLTADLLADGWSTREIVRLARADELERIRRGAFDQTPAADLGQVEQHRRLIAATVRQTSASGVVSHMSAAVLHGLPTWRKDLARVHLTRD